MQTFEVEISTGILKGTVTLPDAGNGGEDPPPPGNGDPSAPGPEQPIEEIYHWYRDGAELSILTKDKKLNGKLVSAQAWYRAGMFSGHIVLDPSSPVNQEPIMVYPRGNHIPFKSGGLARAGLAFGNGWYANKVLADARAIQVKWLNTDEGLGIQFLATDKSRSDRLSRIKKGFPTDWQTYGLFLSWTIGVP